MSKLSSFITAAALASLSSCLPPEPPPPNFRPNPPFAPEPVSPSSAENTGSTQPPADEPARPAPPPPTANGTYPTAASTASPDQVISPYAPYNVIDITGPPHFKSGQLAKDPSNNKIFRVP